MSKTKTVGKKQKAVTNKKVSAPTSSSSRKPIKLGGVPNQGNTATQDNT